MESSTAPSSCLAIRLPASSRPLPNWRFIKTHEATDLELLDQTFPGGRPTSTADHRSWDKLFIRVRPGKPTRTGVGQPPRLTLRTPAETSKVDAEKKKELAAMREALAREK